MSEDGGKKNRTASEQLSEQNARWQKEQDKQSLLRPTYRDKDMPPLAPLHLPKEDALSTYNEQVGLPGELPYTRGIHRSMYRGRHWTMRQYAGFGTAEASNERYRYLLSQGTSGLSVAFDLPTQMGYDSDADLAYGEVGKVGVAIDSIQDMETLFSGIPLDQVSTSMTINATAATLLALHVTVAERQGIELKSLRGTVQNDILKEYFARGTYIYPPRQSMRIITDMFAFCSDHIPQWNTVSVSGYHIREAGSTAAQEIGFTLSNGIAYVQAAVDAGLDVDQFAPRISFFFNVHNNFLEEVAKFRAARRLWGRIMKQRFGAKHPKSLMLRFHSQTAGSTLTAQQPNCNVARVTIQALASVMGGTQSLHTNSKDEALGLPTVDAATLALRTQQIIAHESGVTDYIDPLAGSYVIEELTNQLEEKATEYIQQIDDQGGAVAAIENGFQEQLIQDAAYHYQKAVEKKEAVVVGVNRFEIDDEPPTDRLKLNPQVQSEQIQRLHEFKSSRAAEPVTNALSLLKQAAQGSENLMPRILDCVRVNATLGEIADTLRTVFGTHR